MPFKIAVTPCFWQTVELEMRGDYDEKITGQIKVKFRRPDQDQVDDLVRRLGVRAKTPFEIALDAGTECLSAGARPDTAAGAAKVLAITLARLDALALPQVSAAMATLLAKLQGSGAITTEQAADVVSTVGNSAKALTDQEVIDAWLMDWADVLDENDSALPYNATNLERLNKLLGVRAAIVSAFLGNYVKAPEKNSDRPRGTSTA